MTGTLEYFRVHWIYGLVVFARSRWTHLLAVLLHYANASPPFLERESFYALKDRLLVKHATATHLVWQHIIDRCWGYEGGNGCLGVTCRRCGGTGIHRERNIQLVVFKWGRFTFHKPIVALNQYRDLPTHLGMIESRIQHRSYGYRSAEARLWLYLLMGEWCALWRQLRGSCSCGWYLYPLLTIQRVTMWAAMKSSRRTCWCGRRYWTLGSGWQICRRCRAPRMQPTEDEDSSIPF